MNSFQDEFLDFHSMQATWRFSQEYTRQIIGQLNHNKANDDGK